MCLVPAPCEREKMAVRSEKYLGCFFIEWKLILTNFNQMQVKQIVLKDFGG